MKFTTRAGVLAGLLALAVPGVAHAAPATVTLRVEGPTRTLVEQQITVDVRTFKYSDKPETRQCDGTSGGGTASAPSPTRNGALAEAAERGPFELTGTYFSFGPSFERINGEAVGYDPVTNKFLGEYKNGSFAAVGGCADPVVTGDDVLYAYGDGSEPLLRLAGPATVRPGETATLTVTNQSTTAAVSGASVGGSTTGADGRATTAALTQRGPQAFKATQSGAIRSNAVSVCVTDGADGFCGTVVPGATSSPTAAPAAAPAPAPDPGVASFAKLGGVTEGQRYPAGRGPRTLSGKVDESPVGLRDVRVRLSRTDGDTCSRFDGELERLVVTRRCGVKRARTFSVGRTSEFSYLLPAALPRGRYVLDVIVIDNAGNQTETYQRGRNRVVFFVD